MLIHASMMQRYIPCSDANEYQTSNLPTFNDLVEQGIVKEVSCIENTYDIEFKKSNKHKFVLSVGDVEKHQKIV